MFIGHFAPALVAATHKDAPSLPVLMVAAQLVDWGFFIFAILGVEAMRITPGMTVMNPMDLYHMPYTHSLVGGVAWAAAFGIIITLWMKNRKASLIAAAVVLSHWFLDVLVHTQDMTIAGHPPKLGLGLWNYPAIEMPLEIALTMGALWFYASRTGGWRRPVTVLATALLAVQAFNWFAPPPTEMSLAMPVSALLAFAVLTWLSVAARARR
jgi:predicted outer membrane lipoprotein